MYYSQIAITFTGFTNQIFALITSIIDAYKKKEKVVIVDNFLNDHSKSVYTPISKIFDINELNLFLKKNYDIIIVDKNDIRQFELINIKYGINETNYIDLTNTIKKKYINNNRLFIDKNICLNDVEGDPCPGIVKKLIVSYRINNYDIEEIYDENLNSNIVIDFENGPYLFRLGWIDSFNDNMFNKILKNIKYHDDLILKSEYALNKMNIKKYNKKNINIIHLRLEDDGISHWSKQNNLVPEIYKIYLETKYINLIKKYILKTDINIILCSSSSASNNVLNFLNKYNYNYKFVEKIFDDREKNAIIDLLVSKCCNNIFIGNFNMKTNNGSTFSYYLWNYIDDDNVKKIYIDLDKIKDEEVVTYTNYNK